MNTNTGPEKRGKALEFDVAENNYLPSIGEGVEAYTTKVGNLMIQGPGEGETIACHGDDVAEVEQ